MRFQHTAAQFIGSSRRNQSSSPFVTSVQHSGRPHQELKSRCSRWVTLVNSQHPVGDTVEEYYNRTTASLRYSVSVGKLGTAPHARGSLSPSAYGSLGHDSRLMAVRNIDRFKIEPVRRILSTGPGPEPLQCWAPLLVARRDRCLRILLQALPRPSFRTAATPRQAPCRGALPSQAPSTSPYPSGLGLTKDLRLPIG